MRKGDIRKAAIIETAEALFYTKGYENTSIQDVLDALKLSKGGFYHHFESKLALLDAICEKRVEGYAEECRKYISEHALQGIEKLNCVLTYSSYLKDASLEFISIMLKVAYKEGAVMLRDHMKMATVSLMYPMANEAIAEGIDSNLFYAKYSDELGSILLNLSHCLTDEISLIAVDTDDESGRDHAIAHKLDAYGYACETMLSAPHGSLKFIEGDALSNISASLEMMSA
ncbi:MAG: TetR/AcrR family transcriptional regulator [Clostridia bacterium]|nr:TetR/AcrR family transcriptional regulator [Clostridia bacterium]